MAKSVWKALWLTSAEYRGLQEYLMVQKHGSGRWTDTDVAVYHRYTMRHCPYQDWKATGGWVFSSLCSLFQNFKTFAVKRENLSGVQHPCHVLHYLHKWLSRNDGVLVGMLIVPEMVQKKLVFVLFGADFCLVNTFLYKKHKKHKE